MPQFNAGFRAAKTGKIEIVGRSIFIFTILADRKSVAEARYMLRRFMGKPGNVRTHAWWSLTDGRYALSPRKSVLMPR